MKKIIALSVLALTLTACAAKEEEVAAPVVEEAAPAAEAPAAEVSAAEEAPAAEAAVEAPVVE